MEKYLHTNTYTDIYIHIYIQTEAQIHYTTKQYLQTLDGVAALQSTLCQHSVWSLTQINQSEVGAI